MRGTHVSMSRGPEKPFVRAYCQLLAEVVPYELPVAVQTLGYAIEDEFPADGALLRLFPHHMEDPSHAEQTQHCALAMTWQLSSAPHTGRTHRSAGLAFVTMPWQQPARGSDPVLGYGRLLVVQLWLMPV